MSQDQPQDLISAEKVLEIFSYIVTSRSCDKAVLEVFFNEYPEVKPLGEVLYAIRHVCTDLANGRLEFPAQGQGYIIGNLKSTVSNLRYLSRQLHCLAVDELIEQDPFLGDFSASFLELQHKLSAKTLQLNTLIEKYKNLSQTDALTQLPNRRAFFFAAVREILGARRDNSPLSLIMFDVDFFKKVNDTYGHAAGDAVLKTLAQRVGQIMRGEDLCARYGGEEFVVLLRETDSSLAGAVADRLRTHCCSTPVLFEEQSIPFSISLGVSAIDLTATAHLPPTKALEQSLEQVDKALYAAKGNGRNCVYMYIDDATIERLSFPKA